ncbi:unnamed protein product, partial [Didymodactylos carnosus]
MYRLIIVVSVLFILNSSSLLGEWIAIDDSLITTFNDTTGDRRTVASFQITNYPKKYVKSLRNALDVYSYDSINDVIYFSMEQRTYSICKILKYDVKTKQTYQSDQINQFLVDYIQYNSKSDKLYAIIHMYKDQLHVKLVEIDKQTFTVSKEIADIEYLGSPMSGSYFDQQRQLFTYHAYDNNQSSTVLVTLNLAKNAKQIVVNSKQFDYNVFGFGYSGDTTQRLVALWQYSIIRPLVCIQLDYKTGKQRKNVTITPDTIRIRQGYQPFAIDQQNRQFFVITATDNLQTTYLIKVNIDTLQVQTEE